MSKAPILKDSIEPIQGNQSVLARKVPVRIKNGEFIKVRMRDIDNIRWGNTCKDLDFGFREVSYYNILYCKCGKNTFFKANISEKREKIFSKKCPHCKTKISEDILEIHDIVKKTYLTNKEKHYQYRQDIFRFNTSKHFHLYIHKQQEKYLFCFKNTGAIKKITHAYEDNKKRFNPNPPAYVKIKSIEDNKALNELLFQNDSFGVFMNMGFIGTNYSYVMKSQTGDEILKKFFGKNFTKSIKKQLYFNLSNYGFDVNQILVYKALGQNIKDVNNLLKILRSKVFLQEITTCFLKDTHENLTCDVFKKLDIFFYSLKRIYQENILANHITNRENKESFTSDLYEDIPRLIFNIDRIRNVQAYMNKNRIKQYGEEALSQIPKTRDIFITAHDFLTYLLNKIQREKIDFHPYYEHQKIDTTIFNTTRDNLQFTLAESSEDLDLWGLKLDHCVASYAGDVIRNLCLIIGVFENEKIKYCLEVDPNNHNKIVQARGIRNSFPLSKDMKTINYYQKLIQKVPIQ